MVNRLTDAVILVSRWRFSLRFSSTPDESDHNEVKMQERVVLWTGFPVDKKFFREKFKGKIFKNTPAG